MIEINRKNARIWSMLGMRRVVGLMLSELAIMDDNFTFATADVGRYFGVTEFQQKFSEKYVDVGIAEQNLITVAAGMQKEGMNVFTATYATFITARVLDQIRVSLGYMKLDVKLVGVGGGLAEGDLSATHMGLEDIADLRAIPGITVICPADATETVKALQSLLHYKKPAYLRLTGKTNLPIIYNHDYNFEIGKSICLRKGADIAIIATGCIVGTVLKVADTLSEEGIECKVVDMHTIQPIDTEELGKDCQYKLIVTVEEHMKTGGLGSAVAEYYCEQGKHPVIYRIAVEDEYPMASEYEYLLKNCHLDQEGITEQIRKKYKEAKGETYANHE